MNKDNVSKIFYKYYPPQNWGYVFENWTIRFTPPEEFNDPFECKPHYTSISEETPSKTDMKLSYVSKFIADYKKRPIHEVKQEVSELYKDLTKNDGKLALEFLDEQMRRVGILSLTTNCKNLLMWSHYANSHTGFVISINNKCDLINKKGEEHRRSVSPEKVIYSEQRPSGALKGPGQALTDYYLTKGKQWSYEEEWRVWATIGCDERFSWIDGDRRGIHKLNPIHISEIIFGACMPEDEILEHCWDIRSQQSCMHIELKRAQLHEACYELVIENIPSNFYE